MFADNVASGGYVDRSAEMEYFRLAASLGVLASEANAILEDVLAERQAPRERVLLEQFKAIVDVCIRDRLLDRNEEANLLTWAAGHGLARAAAEQAIEDRCNWAGATRQSTGVKPLSPLAIKAIGAAVSLCLIGVLVALFFIVEKPKREQRDAIVAFSIQASDCLRRGAVLRPADNSVHHWMLMMEAAGGLSPYLKPLRDEVRRVYIDKATEAAPGDRALARAYLEAAAIAAPGPEVADADARLRTDGSQASP